MQIRSHCIWTYVQTKLNTEPHRVDHVETHLWTVWTNIMVHGELCQYSVLNRYSRITFNHIKNHTDKQHLGPTIAYMAIFLTKILFGKQKILERMYLHQWKIFKIEMNKIGQRIV